MQATQTQGIQITDARHPLLRMGPRVAVYVWQYPLRLIHWGLVISIGALAFTGYYIHDPFIVGQIKRPFLMGWFRFFHEAFAMVFIALFLLRIYLFFTGNRWETWRNYVPLHRWQFQEMWQMVRFYLFIRPRPVPKIGHNSLAALSYLVLYALILAEIATGLVMYNALRHSAFLGFLVGWIPRAISIANLRLIHFLLMFVFISFGILHVHLSMLVTREEKNGLMDSIFTGYKVVPEEDVKAEQAKAAPEQQ
jgi:Ni/Fe-hydrogenase 1 B-type cytochrome subunit